MEGKLFSLLIAQPRQTNKPSDRTSERPNRTNQPNPTQPTRPARRNRPASGRNQPNATDGSQQLRVNRQREGAFVEGAWHHTGWVTLLAGDLEQLQLHWQQEETQKQQQ